jgi:hypothetical protein
MRPLWLRRRAAVRLRYRGGDQAHPAWPSSFAIWTDREVRIGWLIRNWHPA